MQVNLMLLCPPLATVHPVMGQMTNVNKYV